MSPNTSPGFSLYLVLLLISSLFQLYFTCSYLTAPSLPQIVNMNSVVSSVQFLLQMFEGKAQEFISEIDNVHMVWLDEIQQEANRMFSR